MYGCSVKGHNKAHAIKIFLKVFHLSMKNLVTSFKLGSSNSNAVKLVTSTVLRGSINPVLSELVQRKQ